MLAAVSLLTAAAGRAAAQDAVDATEGSRFHFGPLGVTPSIVLSNIGIDTNVNNDSANPVKDTTFGLGPAADLAMNVGRSRLTGKVAGLYVYYHDSTELRSFSTNNSVRWDFPFNRVAPFVVGSYSNVHSRVGYEIDTQPRQVTGAIGLGTDLRASAKTTFRVAGAQSRLTFDEQETFDGTNLSTALDHTTGTAQLQMRYALTSLTTLVVGTQAIQDRFHNDPLRDANSLVVQSGFELKPAALISGDVMLGVRRFDPLKSQLPAMQGLVAQIGARFVNGSRRFDVRTTRDIAYSFEETQPYYLLTDVGLTVTQRLTYSWDLVGRGGWQALDYPEVALPDGSVAAHRTDRSQQIGGGLGYRFGEVMRIGFETNYVMRRSPETQERNYDGLRLGVSVTYGLRQ